MKPQHQLFVHEYLKDLNATEAARRAGYSASSESTLSTQASRLMATVEICRAIDVAIEKRATKVGVTPVEVLQMIVDIATADPNELIHHRVRCCRHCHGPEHRYQWKSVDEWAGAVESAVAAHERDVAEATRKGAERLPVLKLPSNEGGFEFNPKLKPVDDCPLCDGDGLKEVILADTRLLKGKARLLYKGVKKTKDGVEILMADQDKARELLMRHFGMLNDKLSLVMPGAASLHNVDELRGKVPDAQLAEMEKAIMMLDNGDELLEAK